MRFVIAIVFAVLLTTRPIIAKEIMPAYPLVGSSTASKFYRFIPITLSKNAWQNFENPASELGDAPNPLLPAEVELGMNNVPVFDQGAHGTCITFAITAAIDALLQMGDTISQLCLLQLGQYLEHNGYAGSDWEGARGGNIILHELGMYGFIPKEQEAFNGCGGLTAYPTDEQTPSTEMTLSDYKLLSVPLDIVWYALLAPEHALGGRINKKQVLESIKQALYDGDRLVISALLFPNASGNIGAAGQYHVADDTWIMTPHIDLLINGHAAAVGHMMIITGYNDTATAVDKKGHLHTGLLHLRNSWGADVGDGGDFYMSYAYFKTMAAEVIRIHSLREG